ncbi:MAG: hypothetical protein LBT99_03620 [Bifidobacteriaceae bacterium]|jgi:DNA-binding transcriptional regulator YiaG|nr:hypothetical protein [Bifidobacteriaceae bacterium]
MVKATIMYGTRAKRKEEIRLNRIQGICQLKDLQKELDIRKIYTRINNQGLLAFSWMKTERIKVSIDRLGDYRLHVQVLSMRRQFETAQQIYIFNDIQKVAKWIVDWVWERDKSNPAALLRCKREYMGLPKYYFAKRLNVAPCTVTHWETGYYKHRINPKYILEIEKIKNRFDSAVSKKSEKLQKLPENQRVIFVYNNDNSPENDELGVPIPAPYFRALAYQIKRRVKFSKIVYKVPDVIEYD